MTTIRRQDLITVLTQLAESRDLQACITSSFKGGCYAGSGALVGGILGGPAGIAIGGIIGSVLGAYNTHGQFKSVVQIIAEMTPQQKQKLYDSMIRLLSSIDIKDVVELTILMNSGNGQALVLKELGVFLKNEFGMLMNS